MTSAGPALRLLSGQLVARPGPLSGGSGHDPTRGFGVPKRDYGYQKRQKELHKQEKRAEKAKRKLERTEATAPPEGEDPEAPPQE
jgi:hypothetical protein